MKRRTRDGVLANDNAYIQFRYLAMLVDQEQERLDGKHGVGVPESEPRSRSPGVGVPESDVIKIWKTRSHMENTESDVREKYGKHGVIWKTRSLTS